MTRTLHVIDQPGEVAQAVVLRLSLDVAQQDREQQDRAKQGGQHAWLLFGGEALRDAARGVGLEDDQFQLLPKPSGLYKHLPAALAKPRNIMDQAHRVVCWTDGAAQIASLLGCAHAVRRVDDAACCPLARGVIAQARGTTVATQAQDRRATRERWGVNEQTKVIALLGDQFEQVDMRTAVMAMAFTHEALRAAQPDDADVRLLCHPLSKRRAEASLFSELLRCDQLLIQDAQIAMPWSVLPGCDVALVPWPAAAGLSMLWAEAMGVPIVSPGDAGLGLNRDSSGAQAFLPVGRRSRNDSDQACGLMTGRNRPAPLWFQNQPNLALQQVVSSRSSKPKDLADALTRWALQRPSKPLL